MGLPTALAFSVSKSTLVLPSCSTPWYAVIRKLPPPTPPLTATPIISTISPAFPRRSKDLASTSSCSPAAAISAVSAVDPIGSAAR